MSNYNLAFFWGFLQWNTFFFHEKRPTSGIVYDCSKMTMAVNILKFPRTKQNSLITGKDCLVLVGILKTVVCSESDNPLLGYGHEVYCNWNLTNGKSLKAAMNSLDTQKLNYDKLVHN